MTAFADSQISARFCLPGANCPSNRVTRPSLGGPEILLARVALPLRLADSGIAQRVYGLRVASRWSMTLGRRTTTSKIAAWGDEISLR